MRSMESRLAAQSLEASTIAIGTLLSQVQANAVPTAGECGLAEKVGNVRGVLTVDIMR